MRKTFILSVLVLSGSTILANANVNQIPGQNQPVNYNYSPGTVAGIINRMPRSLDAQSLINSGPGLIQETFHLFKRIGNNSPHEAEVKVPQDPNVPQPPSIVYGRVNQNTQTNTTSQDTAVNENKGLTEEQVKISEIKTTETRYSEMKNPEMQSSQMQNAQIQNSEIPAARAIAKAQNAFKVKTPAPMQLIQAPAPGYIIRYNEERGVYEEVRELPVQTIQAISNP